GAQDASVKQEVRGVPLSGPYLDAREEELVLEVLRSGRLSLGPTIDRFEEAFAEKIGAPYAAAVSSGTAGLHLLCISAGIGAGDVFAFYPNKQMTTGEGGMVTTHSEEEWRLLRSLRNQGRGDSGGWLEHVRLGFNYRLSDVSAALGIGQLEKLDEILALRDGVAKRYDELLAGIDGVELPCTADAEHERSWFVYVVLLPD